MRKTTTSVAVGVVASVPMRRTSDSILRHLNIDHEEYVDVVEAYRRLAVRSRQSIEINEGDHGKVILWCLQVSP